MPLSDVKKRHAVEVVQVVRERGNRIGDLCAADFVRLGKYAARNGILEEDEPNRLRDFDMAGSTPRDRALGMPLEKGDREDRTWELVRFLERLPGVPMFPTVRLAMLFALATGQRPGECARMPKSELKAPDLWVIAAARRGKSNWRSKRDPQPLEVPLSPLAQELLKLAAVHNKGSQWVFPSPKGPTDPKKLAGPMDEELLPKAIRRVIGEPTEKDVEPAPGKLGIPHFVPNDLRHTARSLMSKLGVRKDIAERVLGHSQGVLVETYDQHPFLDEKRAALDLLGKHLTKLAPKLLPTLRKQAREG